MLEIEVLAIEIYIGWCFLCRASGLTLGQKGPNPEPQTSNPKPPNLKGGRVVDSSVWDIANWSLSVETGSFYRKLIWEYPKIGDPNIVP